MSGPTLTMAAPFGASSFTRSHSSPNIPELATLDYKRQTTPKKEELPRSASFSSIPTFADSITLEFDEHKLHRVVSQSITAFSPLEPIPNGTAKVEAKPNKLSKAKVEKGEKLERVGRRKSLVARPKSWIQRVTGPSPERPHEPEVVTTPNHTPSVPAVPTSKHASERSRSFASFARKSWINSSRSPSPNRSLKEVKPDEKHDASTGMTASPLKTSIASVSPAEQLEAPSMPPSIDSPPKDRSTLGRSATLHKLKPRPQSVFLGLTTLDSTNSSSSSLPSSSVDNRSTPRTSTDRIPPVPKIFPTEMLLGIDQPRKKDELWSNFRSLDNDFNKFQSKSWSLKTNVVRSSLLPFLRNHVSHPSNKLLRPEDIDRRVTVLNKWWNGILEVLDGRNSQSISGSDRPVLLDAMLAIMARPEWRLAPSQFAPLSESPPNRSPDRRSLRTLTSRKSTSSMRSQGSQILAESVYHNVRNMFVQNLTAQMKFVVSKMSLRHAPASVVTFCGKAAAYAFFFVPGIAEILVRIWKIPTETLQRVADALGLPRRPNKADMDEVSAKFPPHTHVLGWSSYKTTANQLRQTPSMTIIASHIPWFGPWITRWCGRDTDLFFVFTKHYHLLAAEFMAPDLPLEMKARAPGFVLVHAQLLAVLDATIHRQSSSDPLPVTFDDVLAGADASATALPLPSTHHGRLMENNRLIMLLRDFMSDRILEFQPARVTFASAFGKVMQASAARTSLFDHNACFVLCDFMEESLSLFVRFQNEHGLDANFIHWSFWLEVCKKMLESQNSMSEIRLFAFLFGAWKTIASDPQQKETICLDWLLTENTFGTFFNHWCPMVRAYYMRLLCWRLCREDGEASDLDTKIFCVIAARLKATWGHYMFLKQAAEKTRKLPPSTASCNPAPGRRLLIIRNDTNAPSTFLGFDGTISSSAAEPAKVVPPPPPANKRNSMVALTKLDTDGVAEVLIDAPTTPNKRRQSFIGRLLPSFLSTSDSPPAVPSTSPKQPLEDARKETALARSASIVSRPVLGTKSSSSSSLETPALSPTHRVFSFKFSLEWAQHFDKNQNLLNGSMASRHSPPAGLSDRRLNPPRLPAPAQSWVGSRVPGMSNEIAAQDPGPGDAGARAKYAGRALSEWALVVSECNNFVERRRAEGVPGLKWVEVPTLGVEGFRKYGAG